MLKLRWTGKDRERQGNKNSLSTYLARLSTVFSLGGQGDRVKEEVTRTRRIKNNEKIYYTITTEIGDFPVSLSTWSKSPVKTGVFGGQGTLSIPVLGGVL